MNPAAPANDRDFVDRVSETFRKRRGAAILILSAVAERFGHVPGWAARRVSAKTGIPLSRLAGIMTFYPHLSPVPPEETEFVVCDGESCRLRGGEAVVRALREHLRITRSGEAREGGYGVRLAKCMGLCSRGPLAVVAGRAIGPLTPADVPRLVRASESAEEER